MKTHLKILKKERHKHNYTISIRVNTSINILYTSLLYTKHAFVPTTYLAKCRNSFFYIAFLLVPSLFYIHTLSPSLPRTLTHSSSSIYIRFFFCHYCAVSIQFHFIPNFSIYICLTTERVMRRREKFICTMQENK